MFKVRHWIVLNVFFFPFFQKSSPVRKNITDFFFILTAASSERFHLVSQCPIIPHQRRGDRVGDQRHQPLRDGAHGTRS